MGLEFSEQVQRLRMVDLVGCPEAMALARPVVDRIIHLTDPFVAGRVEVGALGEVLADQAVGVLVGAALPGMVRQREVEDHAGRLLDSREVGELLATVQRRRAALGTPRQRGRLHVGDVALGVGGGAAADEQAAHAVHERDQARAGPPADHGVALPVVQTRAQLDLGRTFRYGPGPGDPAASLLGPAPPVPPLDHVAQARPDAPFGALQLGRVEPAVVDGPVDGRHGHRQVRTFDPDPAGDLLGRPALPHAQPRDEPGEPRVVEDPGTHAGEPARLVGALRGRCPVAAVPRRPGTSSCASPC